MSDYHNNSQISEEIYPLHPSSKETDSLASNLNRDLSSCIEEYVQIIQFWQYNTGVLNNGSTEILNCDPNENAQLLKEYLFSLLNISEENQDFSAFFPEELLLESLNMKRKRRISSRKSFNIRKIDDSSKKLPNNEDDGLLSEGINGNNDESLLFEDEDSDFDFEYIDSRFNDEDYDELEDNSNDHDVI